MKKFFAYVLMIGLLFSVGFSTVGCSKKEDKKEADKKAEKKDDKKDDKKP